MGAYSQLDMERQYDGAFQEDDTFFEEDEPSCASPVEHGDAAPKGWMSVQLSSVRRLCGNSAGYSNRGVVISSLTKGVTGSPCASPGTTIHSPAD